MLNQDQEIDRRFFPLVGSTNREAARIFDSTSRPVWVLAEQQTSGRGRRGRRWHSPPGNFHASCAYALTEPPGAAALRSFVAALALRDALMQASSNSRNIEFKWPNDLLVRGCKIAGILLECRNWKNGDMRLVVGIGANLAVAPSAFSDGGLPSTCLAEYVDELCTPYELLDVLIPCYQQREAQLLGDGFQALRKDWQAQAIGLGAAVTMAVGDERISGRFSHIDEIGRAVIETIDGAVALAAADEVRFGKC